MTLDKNAQLLIPPLLFQFCCTVSDIEFVTLLSFMICICVNLFGAIAHMLDICYLIFTAVFLSCKTLLLIMARRITNPCMICTKGVLNSQKGIFCDYCKKMGTSTMHNFIYI